jgi:signal peptidase
MASKILQAIYYFIITVIVLLAVLLMVSTFPLKGSFKLLVVESGSMEPAIKTGSVIIIKPSASYKIGDIISFGPVSKVSPATTHRIVEMRAQTGQPVYVTKGDANSGADIHQVPAKDVLGKVLFHIPYIGYVINWTKQPFGFMLLIIFPAVILIYGELKKIVAEVKKLKVVKTTESQDDLKKD